MCIKLERGRRCTQAAASAAAKSKVLSSDKVEFGRLSRTSNTHAWALGVTLFGVNPCVAALMPDVYRTFPAIACLTALMALAILSTGVAWIALTQYTARLGVLIYRCLMSWRIRQAVRMAKQQPLLSLGGLSLTVILLGSEGVAALRWWVRCATQYLCVDVPCASCWLWLLRQVAGYLRLRCTSSTATKRMDQRMGSGSRQHGRASALRTSQATQEDLRRRSDSRSYDRRVNEWQQSCIIRWRRRRRRERPSKPKHVARSVALHIYGAVMSSSSEVSDMSDFTQHDEELANRVVECDTDFGRVAQSHGRGDHFDHGRCSDHYATSPCEAARIAQEGGSPGSKHLRIMSMRNLMTRLRHVLGCGVLSEHLCRMRQSDM